MEIKLFDDYKGLFFFVCDTPRGESGDEFVSYFTTYEEALHEADLQWYRLTEFEKERRRIYVAVSNTDCYPDCDTLADSDNDFIELSKAEIEASVKGFEMPSSDEVEFAEIQKKKLAEEELRRLKIKHRLEMERQNAFMAQLKNSDDLSLCLYWRDRGFPQPSGDEILRIKKETGLSWNEFRNVIRNIEK